MLPFLPQDNQLFFDQYELDQAQTEQATQAALAHMDDGELFLEYRQSESFGFDDGVLKHANYNTDSGFGLRGVLGEASAYAHSTELSQASLKRASESISRIRAGQAESRSLTPAPQRTNQALYLPDSPLEGFDFEKKTKLLTEIDRYIRKKDPLVRQVSASLAGEYQLVTLVRADGQMYHDQRPLVRLSISVTTEKDGRMENGSYGTGGRYGYASFFDEVLWQEAADEALRQSLVKLDAINAPAGEMPVVLGHGWPGVLLHEAIGHGLEGDFNRKKTSAFSGLLGERVASAGVTIVDDGTLEHRRGSLTIDDEGTPTQCTTLIEDGILKGYMQDRMNARLMGMQPTGNGRRESYEHQPLPRMTNTYMLAGKHSPEEMIASVEKGLYAVNFGGGQVDITSGKFVFSASEAYLIENGKVTTPVKGATLIGNGPDVLTKVKMVGNDLELDKGIGTCGKAGQGVPVGVGQPSLLVDQLTVGGVE